MIRKYIRNCKQLFPVYGKYERKFLKQLKEQVIKYVSEFPHLTYDELVTQFGSPKDIVLAYYDSIDDDYLLKKSNLAKNVKRFLVILLTIFLIFIVYRSCMIYYAYQKIQNNFILNEVSTIKNDSQTNTTDDEKQIIYDCISYINDKDIDSYISLFTEDNIKTMQDFIKYENRENFFKEKNVELKKLTKLSTKTGLRSASVTKEEVDAYDDICVYYAEENIEYLEDNNIANDCLQDNGINSLAYVLAKESGKWKILRISTPSIIETFEDGSYLEVYIDEDNRSTASTKTGHKTVTYKTSSGTIIWSVKVTGTFTYDGSTVKCISSTVSTTCPADNWKIASEVANKSGASATAATTAKQYMDGTCVQTLTRTISLTCSKTGSLS